MRDAGDVQLRNTREAVVGGTLDRPNLKLQEPEVHVHAGVIAVAAHQALHCHVGFLAYPGCGGTRRAEHAELPSHLVLSGGGRYG